MLHSFENHTDRFEPQEQDRKYVTDIARATSWYLYCTNTFDHWKPNLHCSSRSHGQLSEQWRRWHSLHVAIQDRKVGNFPPPKLIKYARYCTCTVQISARCSCNICYVLTSPWSSLALHHFQRWQKLPWKISSQEFSPEHQRSWKYRVRRRDRNRFSLNCLQIMQDCLACGSE